MKKTLITLSFLGAIGFTAASAGERLQDYDYYNRPVVGGGPGCNRCNPCQSIRVAAKTCNDCPTVETACDQVTYETVCKTCCPPVVGILDGLGCSGLFPAMFGQRQ
jgi:hypothetical protein